jgi:hypothetical protein
MGSVPLENFGGTKAAFVSVLLMGGFFIGG